MDQIEHIFANSGKFHDRYFGETFTLPNNFETIKIQPNELATYRVVNDSLSKLYDNFIYLYGLTRVSSNIIPDALSGVAGVSANDTVFKWCNISQDLYSPLSAANVQVLDDARKLHAVYSNLRDRYILFAATVNNLVVIETETNSSLNILLSTTKVSIESDLQFINIAAIKTAGNYLYILDSFYSNLYRYNIDGILSDDVFPSQLILDKVIGKQGTFQDKYAFNNPTSLCVFNDNLYVLDAGNYSVKVYDLDLNFVNTFNLKHILVNTQPKYIEVDVARGEFIIATQSGKIIKLTSTFDVIVEITISDIIFDYDTFNSIFVSKGFENIYYIVTELNIYKLYLSKPGDTIGKFTLDRLGFVSEPILCAESAPTANDTSDRVFMFTHKNNATKLVSSSESLNLVSVLTFNDFEVFELSEVQLSAGEYIQPWVINKSIIKLLLNHLRLKDKIKGRFTAIYDQNQVPLLAGTLYFLLDDLDLTAYSITPDHVIGNNEILTNAAVNRGLQKIFDLQESIINKSNVIVQDSGFFINQPVTLP
jgi:hypothetical protein